MVLGSYNEEEDTTRGTAVSCVRYRVGRRGYTVAIADQVTPEPVKQQRKDHLLSMY
jgi:hypothetical protein